MAKKTKDLKITKDELKSIQVVVTEINQLQMQIGGLEVQKDIALSRLKEGQGMLRKLQAGLEDKYGKVSVNLDTGILKPVEDEQALNKKNQYRQGL